MLTGDRDMLKIIASELAGNTGHACMVVWDAKVEKAGKKRDQLKESKGESKTEDGNTTKENHFPTVLDEGGGKAKTANPQDDTKSQAMETHILDMGALPPHATRQGNWRTCTRSIMKESNVTIQIIGGSAGTEAKFVTTPREVVEGGAWTKVSPKKGTPLEWATLDTETMEKVIAQQWLWKSPSW